MLLGVQVSSEEKISEVFKRANSLGCNTLQFFSRNPQQWRRRFLTEEEIKEFKSIRKEFSYIKTLFIHIPYLINLASPNAGLYKDSIQAYIEDIREAYLLGVDYIVTHMGSHKKTSEKKGLRRLILALNTILKETKNTPVKILLENTSGSGSWLGYKFIHHKEVFDNVKQKERLGICFDTAHAYLAGYNIREKEGLEEVLLEIDNLLGLDKIRLIHLNDAKGKLGSQIDRHEHIGKGSIGLEGIRMIVNHPKLRDLPFILETPKKIEADDIENLKTVRSLRKD